MEDAGPRLAAHGAPRRARSASSRPTTIRALLDAGAVVVAAGGGGIPVAHRSPTARSSASRPWSTRISPRGLLAHELGADLLLIPTGVPRVAIRFGTPEQQWLDTHHRRRGARLHRSGRVRRGQHGAEGRRRRRLRRAARPARSASSAPPRRSRRSSTGTSGTRIVADAGRDPTCSEHPPMQSCSPSTARSCAVSSSTRT